MPCNAIDKAFIGRRELWMRCGLAARHEGLHHDPKRVNHHWQETFYAFEFEYGRPTKVGSVKVKRKDMACKRCKLPFSTQGDREVCVCRAIGATKRQAIMFADEREKAFREGPADSETLQWRAEVDEAFQRMIAEDEEIRANDPDNYCAEF